MKLRAAIAAAVGDSSLSSLASFVVGLFAAHKLALDDLGAYGTLFVAAFALGSTTMDQLYFTPVEVAYVELSSGSQLAALRHSVAIGLAIAIPIGMVVISGGMLVIPGVAWAHRLALGAGAVAVAILSPAQDHVRRVLHQASLSSRAAQMSGVQLLVATSTILAMLWLGVGPLAIPFTALAAANAASLATGLVLAHHDSDRGPARPPSTRSAMRVGYLLLLSTGSEQVGGFVAVALLGLLAGAAAVGRYEAARLLAQPLYVLSSALQSVIRPHIMVAARLAHRDKARRYFAIYASLLGAAGASYALVAGTQWPGNPVAKYFPHAFDQQGVLPIVILAAAVAFMIPLLSFQALSTHRERELVRISISNQIIYVGATAVLARSVASLAIPIASLLNSGSWFLRFRPVLQRIYPTVPPAKLSALPEPPSSAPG